MSNTSQEFMRTFRADVAALSCAGAFVAQPHIWALFTEWIKNIEPQYTESPIDKEEHMIAMRNSVLRVDRIIMMLGVISGVTDQDIKRLLEGQE